jgi:beta-glucosidase
MKAAQIGIALLISTSFACIGEYERCLNTSDCVLIREYCGKCGAGEYLCPSLTECVTDVQNCQDLRGTFWDWNLTVEHRVEILVNITTLGEKIQQLQNSAPAIERLYIPAYQWLNDDLHGVNQNDATSFPNGCGLGATWAPDTLEEVGSAIGTEARATHHYYVNNGNRAVNPTYNGMGMTIYGPNVNLVRDPRWGRNQEVNGEDPLLTSRLTVGMVKGAQLKERGYVKAMACCKHFAAYDVEDFPEHRFVYDAVVDNRNMYETYLPVFEACARKVDVGHIMCSYNSVNGVPACGNKALLTDILRKQWNYSGWVVSDYDAWAMIHTEHHYCPNMTCAAALGINAGCDQEGGGNSAINQLPEAIAAGLVSLDRVNDSFRRLFRARFRLGMFDPPSIVPFAAVPITKISSARHLELALRAARESICLYRNHKNVLPLSRSTRIAVVGPNAAATKWLQGNYARPPSWGVVSILEGISNGNDGSSGNCTWDVPSAAYNLPNDTFAFSNSPEECALSCSADLSCDYFTYDSGRCYRLKNMWSRVIVQDPKVLSGHPRTGLHCHWRYTCKKRRLERVLPTMPR